MTPLKHMRDPIRQFDYITWHNDPLFEKTMEVLVGLVKPARIIETGTHMGWTCAWFAEKFPEVNVLTCEVDPQYFAFAQENLEPFENAIASEGSSLRLLQGVHFGDSRFTLFWLDAHWRGPHSPVEPLLEECRIISNRADRYVIVIDDFYCYDPDFEGDTFGYRANGGIGPDDGPDRRVDLSYVAPFLGDHCLRPNYPSKPGYKGYGIFQRGVPEIETNPELLKNLKLWALP